MVDLSAITKASIEEYRMPVVEFQVVERRARIEVQLESSSQLINGKSTGSAGGDGDAVHCLGVGLLPAELPLSTTNHDGIH